MALDFPANPVDGQVFDAYTWNASKGVWQAREESAAVTVVSPTAPSLATNGDLWFNSNLGVLFAYYDDGSTGQWVEVITTNIIDISGKANLAGGNTFSGTQTFSTPIAVGSGGTGTNTLASGGYLKGAGTSAITSQTGIPATDLTGTINHARMPTGSVLQIVYAATNTAATSASGTYVDTNLSASITPKFSTSKVLVLVNQVGLRKDNGNVENSIYLRLLRNGIEIGQFAALNMYSPAVSYLIGGSSSASILDSPGTTSALTYKTQMRNYVNAGTIGVQWYNDASTIILMEIAS